LPFFGKAKDIRVIGPRTRWILRVLLLVAVLVLLWWLNSVLGIEHWLGKAPRPIHIGKLTVYPGHFWLPIMFLLLFAISWIGWWLWNVGSEEDVSPFPDIDAAWDEAVRGLHRNNIDLTEVPLFLVLGRSPRNEEALFTATHFALDVKAAKIEWPVRVYGNRDCVFVTCPGASLMGRHAAILAGEGDAGGGNGESGFAAATENFDPNKTMIPQGHALDVQAVLTRAREEGRDPQHLTEEENQEIRAILAAAASEEAQKSGKRGQSLMRDKNELERLKARLKHFCRLVVRDRRPYCPLNGIMLTIPVGGTDSEDDAAQTATLCQYDLKAAREVFQMHCPMLTLVCDLETIPGFKEFMQRFPESQRQRRVGQRFPLLPDLDQSAIEGKIDEVGNWICNQLVPSWVYKLFRVERPGSDSMEDAVGGNIKLYQFLSQMRERQKRLSKILTRGVTVEGDGPLLFGGCYLAGTGRNAREQAFVEGVFQRLMQDQHFVSWTDRALADEAKLSRFTRLGYISLGVFVALAVVAGYFIFLKSG
jgi:hypothetical protein